MGTSRTQQRHAGGMFCHLPDEVLVCIADACFERSLSHCASRFWQLLHHRYLTLREEYVQCAINGAQGAMRVLNCRVRRTVLDPSWLGPQVYQGLRHLTLRLDQGDLAVALSVARQCSNLVALQISLRPACHEMDVACCVYSWDNGGVPFTSTDVRIDNPQLQTVRLHLGGLLTDNTTLERLVDSVLGGRPPALHTVCMDLRGNRTLALSNLSQLAPLTDPSNGLTTLEVGLSNTTWNGDLALTQLVTHRVGQVSTTAPGLTSLSLSIVGGALSLPRDATTPERHGHHQLGCRPRTGGNRRRPSEPHEPEGAHGEWRPREGQRCTDCVSCVLWLPAPQAPRLGPVRKRTA